VTSVEIWRNPACGTSRKVLALIRNSGLEPNIRLYLEDPPDRATLTAKIAATGPTVRQVPRQRARAATRWGSATPRSRTRG
jgi:arsenate reductase